MADETTPQTATGSDDLDPNLPLGDQHSAVLDDEELHEQLPDEANGDERTALTAAHQGARATTTPVADAAAFGAAADLVLPDATSEHTRAETAPRPWSSTVGLQGGPAGDILADLDPAARFGDGEQSRSHGGDHDGGMAAAKSAVPFGEGDGAAHDAAAPFGSDTAAPSPANQSAGFFGSTAPFIVNGDAPGDPGSGSDSDDGDSAGDAPSQFSVRSSDTFELFSDGTATDQGGGGSGGGVNPIIGDRFDNNLVGTDGRDMINAQDGNDFASGGAGNDLIMGKKGDDTLEGGLGNDTLEGGHGDDTFVFSDADFDGTAWTDAVDGQGQSGKPNTDYDTIDLTNVSQGWTLEVDGAGAEATDASNPSQYTQGGGEFSGTITFDDGSTIAFDHIERIDW